MDGMSLVNELAQDSLTRHSILPLHPPHHSTVLFEMPPTEPSVQQRILISSFLELVSSSFEYLFPR